MPNTETLLGPFRFCDKPNTFRSKRVTNATFTNTGIMKTICWLTENKIYSMPDLIGLL